uniref:PNPLA domain-containing protein n=1 Tax=viral metagenome TaxID=1070528 RepID=A0A6C0JW33_9ZZZZ
MSYEAICVPGGSVKMVTLLGLLYEYHKQGKIQDIKTWSVCSAGALISVLYLIGKNPLQILDYFPKIENIKPSMELLDSLFRKAGIKRIQKYTKRLRSTVYKFVSGDADKPCTLKEFYDKTGVLLYIEVVNVDKQEVVYFNYKDHPDVLLFDCIHASACIPFVFMPITINGEKYIDGGVYNGVPLDPLLGLRTLAFSFKHKDKDDVLDKIAGFVRLQATMVKNESIKRMNDFLTLVIVDSNFDIFDFSKTHEELLSEFAYGRSQYNS